VESDAGWDLICCGIFASAKSQPLYMRMNLDMFLIFLWLKGDPAYLQGYTDIKQSYVDALAAAAAETAALRTVGAAVKPYHNTYNNASNITTDEQNTIGGNQYKHNNQQHSLQSLMTKNRSSSAYSKDIASLTQCGPGTNTTSTLIQPDPMQQHLSFQVLVDFYAYSPMTQ